MSKPIIAPILLALSTAYPINCSMAPATMRFPEILKIFNECSATFFQFPLETFETAVEDRFQVATQTIPNLKNKFSESLLLQYKISTNPYPVS